MIRTGHRSRRFVCTLLAFALVFGVSGIQPAYAASTLETSLDTALTVTTGGNAEWFAVNSVVDSHDGVDHAESGDISDNQSSWFEITVNGPGDLTWYSKTVSEPNWDWLRVSDNGVDQPSLAKSGVNDWALALYVVPAGTHTIRWTYQKDGNGSLSADIGFVDDISFANTAPVGRVDGAHLDGNEVQLLPTAPAAGDLAGGSVAISNNTLASGASGDDTGAGVDAGSVSIYKRVGGTWQPYQLLTANDEIENGRFGTGVALDDVFLSVANPTREKIYTYMDNGIAFVPWGGPLPAPEPSIGFGGAIAQSGTTLVAGCRAYNGYVGRVYVYVYSFGWSIEQVIDPPDGAASDQFGLDVEIDGDRLIVGAPGHQHAGAVGGAAYVYDRSGGTWTLSGELNDSAGAADDEMGSSVAVSGNTAVVGDPNQSTVDVFTLDGTWSRTDILTPPTAQTLTSYGNQVAIDGDTILSGDGFYDGGVAGGTVFAYARANGIFFDLVETIQPAVPDSFASYGDAVDIDGAQFAVGSRVWGGPAGSTQGSAYAYDGAYYHVMAGGTLSVPATMGVVVNDVDAEQDTVVVASYNEPAGGVLNLFSNGSLTFVADDPAAAEIPLDYAPSDTRLTGGWTNSFITVAPAPAGDPVFNGGSGYVNSTSVGIVANIDNVKMYRTRIDTNSWGAWTWFTGPNLTADLGAVADGSYQVSLEVKGSGGNRSFSADLSLDTTDPVVSLDPFALLAPGDSVHLSATDVGGSGVKRIGYSIDGDPTVWTDGNSVDVPFPSAGVFDLGYWAEDNAGNVSAAIWESDITVVQSDTTDPVVSLDPFALLAPGDSVHLSATDVGGSGVKRIGYSIDGDPTVWTDGNSVDVPFPSAGVFDLGYWAEDNAGNVSAAIWESDITVAQPEATYSRFSGTDRYGTAIKASQSAYATGECRAVIIATGLNYPDALAAAGLGGAANSPVLLVGGDVLRADVKAEIKRLVQGRSTYKVYILGSTAAVTAKMEASIKASLTGESVERFAGKDRYATAQLVALKVKALRGTSFGHTAILVPSLDYVDGLLVGPAAFKSKAPILLVNTTADAGLKATLKTLGTTDLVICGTGARIPTSVETALKSAVPGLTTRRVSNLTDTYARSAAAAEYFANPAKGFGLTWDGLGVATAEAFPDGLSAGCVEGKYGTSLLLTKKLSLPSVIGSKIAAHDTEIGTVRFYGSTAAVSTPVETSVRNLLP